MIYKRRFIHGTYNLRLNLGTHPRMTQTYIMFNEVGYLLPIGQEMMIWNAKRFRREYANQEIKLMEQNKRYKDED